MILTILDTAGIQDYIFNTNKLRQIVGASHLVNCASRDWVKSISEQAGLRHNILNLDSLNPDEIFSNKKIETGELDLEVIYAGGGNTLLMFANLPHAEEFTRLLTKRVLIEAPGLRLAISHISFDWQNQPLGGMQGVIRNAFDQLSERKNQPSPVTNEPGWGVTVECAFTALPAVGLDHGLPISSEIKAKLDAETGGNARLKNLVNFQGFLEPPADFDEMGRSEGEKSLLAVVHTDGNGLGKRVSNVYERYPQVKNNSECKQALRAFSISIQRGSLKALQATVDHLIENVDESQKIAGEIKIHNDQLPFRPIVFGGDDLTFVCDGRIGLDLAAYYLESAAQQELTDGGKLFCRAGVAIVKTHYPFARAYSLAEELCQSSKKFIEETEQEITKAFEKEKTKDKLESHRMCVIDWHFAVSGVLNNLGEIRQREFTNDVGKLTMRPLSIHSETQISPSRDIPKIKSSWRTWENFLGIIGEFRDGADWAGRHNKVKALRQALREGQDSVKDFCINFGAELPGINEKQVDRGWVKGDDHCAYFDAVEALDVFIQLKNEG